MATAIRRQLGPYDGATRCHVAPGYSLSYSTVTFLLFFNKEILIVLNSLLSHIILTNIILSIIQKSRDKLSRDRGMNMVVVQKCSFKNKF